MIIQDIYDQFPVRKNIQEHMYRVAAVAKMLVDALWLPDTSKHILISAALIHDIAKLIRIDLTTYPEANQPEGLSYRKNIQQTMREKYGVDDEQATLQIIEELGLSDKVYTLVEQLSHINNPKSLLQGEGVFAALQWDNLLLQILTYADRRVDPKGIVSIRDRHAELYARLVDEQAYNDQKLKELTLVEQKLSTMLQTNQSLLADITSETASPIIEELKEYALINN